MLTNNIINFVNNNNIKIAFINHLYKNYSEIKNVQHLINYLKDYSTKIFIIGNAEFINVGLLSNIEAKKMSKNDLHISKFNSDKYQLQSRINLNNYVSKFAKENEIDFINEYDFFCNENECYFFSNDYQPYFYDNSHLTKSGEEYLQFRLIEFLKKSKSNLLSYCNNVKK